MLLTIVLFFRAEDEVFMDAVKNIQGNDKIR